MKANSTLISSAIIAVGMIIMGGMIRDGIVTFKDRDRTVSVKGLAERELMADRVTWTLTYKEIGNDPSEMYDNLEQKNKKITQFLLQGGITKDEISVGSPTIVDRQADNYGNEIMNYRYKAINIITVTSPNINKVRNMLTKQAELMKQGIALVNNEYGESPVRYEFMGLNNIKPEMIEEATKNARKTAEKFAEDSNTSLGGIRTAQQGQFSIEDRDANTPYMKKIRVVTTLEYSLK